MIQHLEQMIIKMKQYRNQIYHNLVINKEKFDRYKILNKLK